MTSAAASQLARRARAARPGALAPAPLIVDALVELGRFGAAERELQRLVDTKPTLAGYARVSYLRELHGDLGGAVAAMRRAVAAGGAGRESTASVQALLGGLELARGNLAAAGRAQRAALAAVPGYPAALAGLARLAAARGDLDAAGRRWQALATRLPLPEYVVALGETRLAQGRRAAARREFRLVGAERRLLGAAGVDTDAETAVYEADHGAPRRALALARRAWRAAPGVRAADAMGWALTRAGRPARGAALGAPRARARQPRPAPAPSRRPGGARRRRARGGPRAPARRAGRRPDRLAVAGAAGTHRTARRSSMRIRIALAAAAVALGIAAAPAAAHPLGNFSVNHLTQVRISADRVDVRYLLDQAEIPTFRERGLGDAEILRRKRAEVAERLVLTVDGRTVALRPAGRRGSPTPPVRAGCARRGSSCR